MTRGDPCQDGVDLAESAHSRVLSAIKSVSSFAIAIGLTTKFGQMAPDWVSDFVMRERVYEEYEESEDWPEIQRG